MPTALVIALFVAVSVTLLSPDSLAEKLALDAFRMKYRIALGPAWLLLTSILGTKTILYLIRRVDARVVLRTKREQLHVLTPEEQGYLAPFIQKKMNTIHEDMTDGVAGGLKLKGIIYPASDLIDIVKGVPYNLYPWAREYLTQHPELLKDAVIKPRNPHGRRRID